MMEFHHGGFSYMDFEGFFMTVFSYMDFEVMDFGVDRIQLKKAPEVKQYHMILIGV
jgi:hypothetical protein